MSSATVDHPIKVGMTNKKENEIKARKMPNPPHKKHKHEENRHFKFGRKRLQSFTNNGKFFPPHKRRKKEGIMIPPTKFLLGGNICDPLNLNSMQDEEVNRALNAVTPKSSPLPTPKHRKEAIEVIIPPNIHDPLNLTNCNDDAEYEKQLISPVKKTGKKKHKHRKKKKSLNLDGDDKNAGSTETKDNESKVIEEAKVAEMVTEQVSTEEPQKAKSPAKEQPVQEQQQQQQQQPKVDLPPPKEKVKLKLKCLEEPKDKRLRKLDSKDKIVSPVIPQPGAWMPRLQHRPNQDKKKMADRPMPRFNNKNARFQYGNYNRYYGYRNPQHEVDPRLAVFSRRRELFYGKDVLDIGCNIGHITLSVASDFGARSVTGIDIDKTLIQIARKNVKHYVNCYQSQSPAVAEDGTVKEVDPNVFPVSMVINYGPIDVPGFTKHDYKGFPYNVTFVQGNYILDDDALLASEQPQFDTILCLSTTKWIHLNFGDAGLKQCFKRMYAQLKPGGVLILEPQGWSGYKKRKKLTEKIFSNYQNIEFYPHKFSSYLTQEVGFRSYETISVPGHTAKGFQRSILLFKKAALESTPATATVTSAVEVDEPKTSEEASRRRRANSEQPDEMLINYGRDLFNIEQRDPGSLSGASQRSAESLSQYENLANIYAPSTTPSYEQTPQHFVESNNVPEKQCYVDVKIDVDEDTKTSEGNQSVRAPDDVVGKVEDSQQQQQQAGNQSGVSGRDQRPEDSTDSHQQPKINNSEDNESSSQQTRMQVDKT